MTTARPAFLAHLDHSLLAPNSTWSELEDAARVALELEVAALCIIPSFVARATELVAGSRVAVCTVIGFPHGTTTTAAKLAETRDVLALGAREIDVVVNPSDVLSNRWEQVHSEMKAITSLVHDEGALVKWIFETCLLDDAKKQRLCEIASEVGVDWVKTSTGFGAHGATAHDVKLLRSHVPDSIQVKASGGIRTLAEVESYLALGASRIGTSRSSSLLAEWSARSVD